MRRLILLTVTALAAAAFIGTSAIPAFADGCPPGTTPAPGHGFICIPATDPGDQAQQESPTQPVSDPSPQGCSLDGEALPCTYAGGAWSNDRGCYLVLTYQPPAGAAAWQGHSPNDGHIYACVRPWIGGNPVLLFIPNGPGTPPNPAVLSQRALDQMLLTVPDIHVAPAPPAQTYVGLETWLWMPPGQWAPLTKSVTAGSTTVTVTAEPLRVRWDMGTGSTVCYSAGRAWVVGQMPADASSSCQFTYEQVSAFQPDGKFGVAATITFDVRWTCSGTCLASEGSLGEVEGLPGTSAIRVGERQSVNITPRGQ